MRSPHPSENWRSSSSRLLALYSFLFVAWGCVLMGTLYWEVSHYLDGLAQHSLLQRAHLYARFDSQRLDNVLTTGQQLDVRAVDGYGLFDQAGRQLSGKLTALPAGLPVDGQVHALTSCAASADASAPQDSCDAVATRLADGRVLLLVRDNGSLGAVNRIILHALAWGLSLTVIPGLLGWHLLRRRPRRRIAAIQRSADRIVAGHFQQRLPLSSRRDELDMLAAIVNGMLDRLERLLLDVKGVCDNIAHDLRTPLTRLRARLHRAQQEAGDTPQAAGLGLALQDTDELLARFSALLRIAELEDRQRRSAFVELDPRDVLQEAHAFYEPLAEEKGLDFVLEVPERLPPLIGDRGLLFEALSNLLNNAIKFTPAGGVVRLSGREWQGDTVIEVADDGPGIAPAERESIFRRFYRSVHQVGEPGFGLGLSIVAAIAELHDFELTARRAEEGGASFILVGRAQAVRV